jgi:diguanylate cyclase (GGDEF)-like protein
MSPTDRPANAPPVVDVTDGTLPEPAGTGGRIQQSFRHLLEAFGTFTAVRNKGGMIVDFHTEYVSDASRVGAPPHHEPGDDLVSTLAEHNKRELFEDLCHVVETGEPLITQSRRYEDAEHGGRRLIGAFEVRAAKLGDGVALGWRDVTAHVLAEAELERRNRELTLVGEMAEYLQAVESSDEVLNVAASFGSRLFGDFSGGLFLRNDSGSVVEAMSSWGDSSWGDQVFAPDACWALRRGRRHGGLGGNASPSCAHVADGVDALCIPLIAQGQATGLLVLAASGTATLSDTPPSSAASEALAVSVGEHLGLALTNLRLRESLRDQSIRDPLTGLFNRRYLEETLEREISRAARSGKPIGLMMLDVDHFKQFNDTFGHPGGDALMRELGALLHTHTRAEDAACRYGGDEFVVLLPESPLDVTLARAEELRKAAHLFNIMHEGMSLSAVTLTVGVSAYPLHGADLEGLVHAADDAMFSAKRAGGDRVQAAVPPDD